MFFAVVLPVLIIFNSAIFAQSFNQSNLKLKETSCLPVDSQIVLTEKSPFLAGAFSFAVPGFALGQIYNKQYSKFFVHTIISSACIVTAFLSIDRGTEPNFYESGTQTCYTLSTISIAAMYVYAGN